MELDQMIELAGDQARRVLLEAKQPELLTTWMLEDDDGGVRLIATPWRDDSEKAKARAFIRDCMRANRTVRYSFVTEAWQAFEKPGEYNPEDPDWVRPRDRADRIEVVVAIACDKERSVSKSWQIIRNHLEQIIALNPLEQQEGALEGWVASMLR
jgi:hypothetical protein